MKLLSVLAALLLTFFIGGAMVGIQAAENVTIPADAPPPNYVIQPSDLLQMRVFQEPDLSQEFRMPQDGIHQFPLIGPVDLRGRTIKEAEELLRALYDRDFLVNPQINLLILEYAQRRVNVLGQVNAPGTVVFPPEEEMTLLDAIGRAGGFTRLANPRHRVEISRRNPDGTIVNKNFDISEIRRGNAQNPRLERDDVIFVPERLF